MSAGASRPPWRNAAPGRVMGPGHTAGDFLHAPEWRVIEEREGYLELDVPLPDHVRNPRGQLFGGFAPTYVDLIALHTLRAGHREDPGPRFWLATVNMRIDFLDPVVGSFVARSEILQRRGRNVWVQTRFCDAEGRVLVSALTVLRESDQTFPSV